MQESIPVVGLKQAFLPKKSSYLDTVEKTSVENKKTSLYKEGSQAKLRHKINLQKVPKHAG